MGLALLDVADVIRPHPEVVAFLQQVEDDGFLDELPALAGGREARDAIQAWLDGTACAASARSTSRGRAGANAPTLVPILLATCRELRARRRRAALRAGAAGGVEEGTGAAGALAGPAGRGAEGRRDQADDRPRPDFIGYREYPKYGMVSRYFVYKQALLEEAERLVQAGVLREEEDIFYLRFQELHDVVRTNRVDDQLIRERKDAFRSYQALTPPRVLTSDGEIIAGAYRRDDLPAGALVGLPVSAGTVEGRARVILDMAKADLEPGDILVTAYTDPSWTPCSSRSRAW
jgi:rifampicin phosphotransferase